MTCPRGGLLSESRLLIKCVMLWLEHSCPWRQGCGHQVKGVSVQMNAVSLGRRRSSSLSFQPFAQTCLSLNGLLRVPPLPDLQPDRGCHSASVIRGCPLGSSWLSRSLSPSALPTSCEALTLCPCPQWPNLLAASASYTSSQLFPSCLESPDPRCLLVRLLSPFTSLLKGRLLVKPELTP